MINNFNIYDASAGSGKTFNLATNYIVTAMIHGFKTTLAVTFTNAAAKEMKDRIIEVLQNISEDKQNRETLGYKSNIIRLYNQKTNETLSDIQIKAKCYNLLRDILHHYSFFYVTTIDSFFQTVLKNLTKELGIQGNYILTLDAKKYDKSAINQLVTISEQKENENTLIEQWLTNFFEKESLDGKSWNIEKVLNSFVAKAFKSDTVNEALQSGTMESLSINNLDALRMELGKEIKLFENTLQQKRDKFISRCKEIGLDEKDFKDGRKNGVYNYILKMPEEITTIEELENRKCLEIVQEEYYNIINYLKNNYNGYLLNRIYYDNIYQLGVLNNISNIKSELLKQDNVFVLDNTASLLQKLNEGDVPFVFEKISQRIENIFIDEFQDTNRASYSNLRKLMDECLHNGGTSSIFGDIKQSIYRFNGGDFRIMHDLTQQNPQSIIHLSENFRSLGNIVQFNNEFFKPIYDACGIDFYCQQIMRSENLGIVRLQFAEKKQEDAIFGYIVREIDYYHKEKGYALNDIAVLFRSNDKLIDTATKLKRITSFDYNPVSDIAFKFSSSLAVNKIIETLKYILNNQKHISKEVITYSTGKDRDANIEKSLLELTKSYKKEKSLLELVIKIANILNISDDAVFLPAFYDTIKNYTKTNIGNLAEFIDYWDETLKDKSVDMANVQGGVRLTSIHKSKGLAYRVVIVPYCDNSFYKSDNIWVKSNDQNSKLPFFMTRSSNLENTSYKNVFESERNAQYTDTINLLYVAFTRSRDNLSVISTLPSETALKKETAALNTLLYRYVTEQNPQSFAVKSDNLFLYHNCESTNYQAVAPKPANDNEIMVNEILFSQSEIAFSTSNEEDLSEFFDMSYKELSKTEKGTIYHSFVSNLITENDIDNIILHAENSQVATHDLKNILQAMILCAKDRHWYDNTYKVLNERAIISFDGSQELHIKRPDRIMFSNDEVIVVDYKFATEKESHHQQVSNYMSLLSRMNIFANKTITGYLFYIDTEKDVKCNIIPCKM